MEKPLSPLNLPVRTELGKQLGHVVDLTIDPGSQTIVAYHVKTSRLMPDLVQSPLIIHHTQVVRLDEKEMIVDDAVTRGAVPGAVPMPSN